MSKKKNHIKRGQASKGFNKAKQTRQERRLRKQWQQRRSVIRQDDLLTCAASGDLRHIRQMFDKSNINLNVKDSDGCTAYLIALKNSHYEIAAYLERKGADITLCDKNGNSAFHILSAAPSNFQYKKMLEKGFNIDAKNRDGLTPLMVAAKAARPRLVEMLLQYGANPHITDEKGNSALLHAAQNLCSKSIDKLLTFGADATLSNIHHNGIDKLLNLPPLHRKEKQREQCWKVVTAYRNRRLNIEREISRLQHQLQPDHPSERVIWAAARRDNLGVFKIAQDMDSLKIQNKNGFSACDILQIQNRKADIFKCQAGDVSPIFLKNYMQHIFHPWEKRKYNNEYSEFMAISRLKHMPKQGQNTTLKRRPK